MSTNLMPGTNAGAEPPTHRPGCRTQCEFADAPLAEGETCPDGHDHHRCSCDDAFERFMEALADA